jgi:hypothetical protein
MQIVQTDADALAASLVASLCAGVRLADEEWCAGFRALGPLQHRMPLVLQRSTRRRFGR